MASFNSSRSLDKSFLYSMFVIALAAGGLLLAQNNNFDIRGRAATSCAKLNNPCGGPYGSSCCSMLSCVSNTCVLPVPTNIPTATPTKTPTPTPTKTPTPTPTESYTTHLLISGNCNDLCRGQQGGGTCVTVGIDTEGTNGYIMRYNTSQSCYTEGGGCGSRLSQRTTLNGIKCQYHGAGIYNYPDWAYCRCKNNPYAF